MGDNQVGLILPDDFDEFLAQFRVCFKRLIRVTEKNHFFNTESLRCGLLFPHADFHQTGGGHAAIGRTFITGGTDDIDYLFTFAG